MRFRVDGESTVSEGLSAQLTDRLHAIREAVPYSKIFRHYGYTWETEQTHQLSCVFHARYRSATGQPVERNPSARYYAQERMIWCFACNEGGDVVWFVRKKEKLSSLGEAIRKVGQICGKDFRSVGEGPALELQEIERIATERQGQAQFKTSLLRTTRDQINDLLHQLCRTDAGFCPIADRMRLTLFEPYVQLEADQKRLEFNELASRLATWSQSALHVVDTSWKLYYRV